MISVCTLVHDREKHLQRMLRGLVEQTLRPSEVIIARMNEPACGTLSGYPFAVKEIEVTHDLLPLAKARNDAARNARYGKLVFVDVDCIPGPDLVETYRMALALDRASCCFGPVRYGQETTDYTQSFDHLWEASLRHPARMDPDDGDTDQCPLPPRELWGLSFALTREQFANAGGFDERFSGYGAEETDFAKRLGDRGTRFVWYRNARAVHQHHPVHKPPLHHFSDIIRNAELFRQKHGSWPMTYWLGQFEDMGLIRRHETIEILREPGAADIAAARMPGHVAFS